VTCGWKDRRIEGGERGSGRNVIEGGLRIECDMTHSPAESYVQGGSSMMEYSGRDGTEAALAVERLVGAGGRLSSAEGGWRWRVVET
jgi:hypothetical protein